VISRLLFVCLLFLVGPSAPGHAAESRADEIALARLDFERAWIAASLAELKKQLIKLTTLETQLAEARDYDGAIRVRDQRQKWQRDLERLDKELLMIQSREHTLSSALLADRIQLPIEAASLNGVVREGGMITAWAKPGASATWKLPTLPPGGYEVVLRYRCSTLEGGFLSVKETRFSLSAEIKTTLRGPESLTLGTLKLSEGASTLSLTATTVFKDNLMQLLAVELIPASR